MSWSGRRSEQAVGVVSRVHGHKGEEDAVCEEGHALVKRGAYVPGIEQRFPSSQ